MSLPSRVSSIYGTSRQLPKSYLPRRRQQEELRAALSADGHMVIWGEPRQGKSSLLRHQLPGNDYSVIDCGYTQQRYDIYRMILREAGASVAVEQKRRRARGIGARVSFLTGDLRSESETTERAFDIDISNITDVLRVIDGSNFHKHVVLDDFHHLGRPVQREIVQDLKTIYEKSELRLIIVGVWADRDQLRGLHIDLGGRVDSIEVPRWQQNELADVLSKGENLLSVRFSGSARNCLIERAQQSVGLLQDLAREACLEAGYDTAGLPKGAEVNEEHVAQAVRRVLEHSSGRLRWYISTLGKKRTAGSGKLYKNILHALLITSDEVLQEGIPAARLLAEVRRLYPFEASKLTYDKLIVELGKMGAVHRELRVQPILEYDAVGERLHVVDPLARLYMMSTDRQSLISYLPDRGRDIEGSLKNVYQVRFREKVLERYGEVCAVCPVTRLELITAVRLQNPQFGYSTAPDYGLPFCRNHAAAWKKDLFAFEPETTRIICIDRVAINITKDDLTHLRALPKQSALEHAWRYSGWRLDTIWGDDSTDVT